MVAFFYVHKPPAGEIKDNYRKQPHSIYHPQPETWMIEGCYNSAVEEKQAGNEPQAMHQVDMQYIIKKRHPAIYCKYIGYLATEPFK